MITDMLIAKPDLVMECVRAVSLGFGTTKKVVSYVFAEEYSLVSPRNKGQVGKAIQVAERLGLLRVNGSDIYSSELELVKRLRYSDWNNESKILMFREYLQQYPPYVLFHSFLEMGNDSNIAAIRVGVYYGWKIEKNQRRNAFEEWGLYADMLVLHEEKISVVSSISNNQVIHKNELMKKFITVLDSEMASRSFILSFLGLECYTFLEEDIKTDLMNAMILVHEKPDDAVKLIGTALEDYIKLIAKSRGIALLNNGRPIKTIGSMIDKLRQEGILANHHVNTLKGLEVYTSADLFQGLNSYRKMPVHGKDFDADVRWSLSTEVALIGILQLLLSIRSTHYYLVEKQLMY